MPEQDAPIPYPLDESPSLHEPPRQLAELREGNPVARVQLADGSPSWLVTRYADVRTVVTDARFSRAVSAPDTELTVLAEMAKQTMLGMDPPDHTRLRRLVTTAFTPRRVEDLRPAIAGIVGELIDGMEAQPHPVDLVQNFSLPLPMRVICELLGAPAEDGPKLHEWSEVLIGGWDADAETAQQAMDTLYGYFGGLADAKRAEPGDDLMTALIVARDEEDGLSERELVAVATELLAAGHEASVTYLNLLALTLMQRPDEAARLREDPALVPSAVEELVRFVQVNPDGAGLPRFTTEPVELDGVTIPAGAVVIPAYGSANRDPRRFDDPDRLDLTREPNPHLAFGSGIHHCLGAALARTELQEAVRGLLTRLPGLKLAVPESALRLKPGALIRNFEELPVTW
jgi:cytochrome P450